MEYALQLDLRKKAGDVVDYCEQPQLLIAGVLRYKPDFLVIEPDKAYYVDIKGVETKEFKKILDAWPARTGLPLRIVKKKGGSFVTTRET